jgi:WD40 repeat protein/tRNA A-37 threonylcarbamoyl transferase component Bud32
MAANSETDRNLLFGVLCLQAGLLDAPRFAEVCTAWTARKDTPLADLLAERGWLTAEDRAHVEFLLARRLDRHGGDARRSLAACADEAARQVLATLDDVEVRNSLAELPARDGQSVLSTAAYQPQNRGRYTLTRLHAEGGIGQVWLAYDHDLGREVALKELRPERVSSPTSQGRFLDEARITGQLEHPGIVPVYELARPANGQASYYTMRFIKGRTLREAIRDYHEKRQKGTAGPLDLNALLTAFVAVCNAVAYAHSRGVLHRDLKPQNVVLGDYGEVLVLDWGLARLVDRPESDSETAPVVVELDVQHEATVQGQVLGTPAYMAPEQAAGRLDLIDRRTDVYGLGAILYEILAGRPPFHEVKTPAMLSVIGARDPEPPRQVAGGVSPALEAVCLKALAKKREARYATAGELADEVRCWLADEPIAAWPEPFPRRLARWGRRHKPLVAGAAALLVAAVAALALGTFLLEREQRRTEQARAQADANFHEAAERALALQRQSEALERQAYITRVNLAYRECLANNVAQSERLLDGCPEARRGWEWSYCRRLCHLESLTIAPDAKRHGGRLDIVFGPDGTIAAGNVDGTITLWDAATGQEVRTLRGHSGPVFGVAFSPDGRQLASGGGMADVKLWDVGGGQELRSFRGPAGRVPYLRFSPDGRRLAAGSATGIEAPYKPGVKVWELATGHEGASFQGRHWGNAAVAFSPDGRRLASVNEWMTDLRFHDPATGREVRTVDLEAGDGGYAVAWASDGRRLAVGGRDGSVVLWDADANARVAILRGHTGGVHDVAFSSDGRLLATAGADGAVKVWDATVGREIASYRGHTEPVFRVGFGPDGTRLATMAWDQTIKIWEVADHPDVPTLRGNRGWAFRTAFSPDGTRLVTAGFNIVIVRAVASGQTVASFLRPGGGVQGLALSPDGRQVASSGEFAQTFELHDAETGRLLRTFRGHTGRLRAVAFAPNGRRLASASEDRTVRLWDAQTGKEVLVFRGHPHGVFAVAFAPNGGVVASIGWNDTVRLWDAATGRELRALAGAAHRPPTSVFGNALAISPDARRLAAPGERGTVLVWDVDSGGVALTLAGHTGDVYGIAFSADGRRIVSAAADQTLKLWDAATGEEVITLRGHTDGVLGVAFSPDGLRIASASADMTVKLWEAVAPDAASVRRRRAAVQALPLNEAAWPVVREPNRPAADYERALRQAEEACRSEPRMGLYRNTLGVAQYRAGRYADALESLTAADRANSITFQGSIPPDLAFLAMAHERLGHHAEARTYLERLRQAMKAARWRADAESVGFVKEAERLIDRPDTSGVKPSSRRPRVPLEANPPE